MRNIFILEQGIQNNKPDSKLFDWAIKINSLGFNVSQIWEGEYDNSGMKGINFSRQSAPLEGIILISNGDTISVEVEYDFLTNQLYLEFIGDLISL